MLVKFAIVLILASAAFAFLINNDSGAIEHITDDGLYFMYINSDCQDDKATISVKLGLTPVKDNLYNTCRNVTVYLRAASSNATNDLTFEWPYPKSCQPNRIRIEKITFATKEQDIADMICADTNNTLVGIYDYTLHNSVSSNIKSDPLGQQPRMESSIPVNPSFSMSLDVGNPLVIKAIQTKLAIEGRYNGPIDGLWSDKLENAIRILLDDNSYYFLSEDSEVVLNIMDINSEKFESRF